MPSQLTRWTYPLLLTLCPNAVCEWPRLRHRDPDRQRELRAKIDLVRRERPRIFATPDQLAEARERMARDPGVRECFGWLRDWAYSDPFYRNLWATPKQLQAAAFCYRFEDRPAEVLEHCLAIVDHLCEAQPNSWTYPRVVRGLSMAYDWLYDDLSPAQRQRIGGRILECAKACYRTWRHSEINNHLYLEYGPVLYASVALHGEGIEEPTVEQLLLDGIELLLDNFLPAHEIISGTDGGWYESMGYHAFFTPEYAHLLELWSSATGEDVWRRPGALQGDAHWLVYLHRPWDNSRAGMADIGGRDSFDTGVAWYLPLLAARHRDGVAKWWLEQLRTEALKRHDRGDRYALAPHMWWPSVLWSAPELEVCPSDRLPPSRLFRNLGWVATRSDWTRDASYGVFICGDWFGGHQQCDNNSFVIHRRAPLAIDSGVYDAGPHRANYSARSVAHNTILVHDPDEVFSGGTWGQHTDEAHRTVNDGGQLYTPSPERARDVTRGSVHDRADIIAYRAGPGYTYAVGDATRSYNPGKLKEFTRTFLHLRPHLFVVFDRVESTRAQFRKTWLLHSVKEPEVTGDTIHLTNGPGTLWCRRAWPREARVKTIGGPGHEFEVDGRNFPSKKANAESGAWRVECTPATAARRDLFLHVVSTAERPEVTCEQVDGGLGVVVEAQGRTYRVEFAAEGPARGRVVVTGGGPAATIELGMGIEEE